MLKRSIARLGVTVGTVAVLAISAIHAAGCGSPYGAAEQPIEAGDADSGLVGVGPSDSGDAGDARGAPDATDATTHCPTGRGPAMVAITAAGSSFCIDSTEVTQAQYAAFLASAPATFPQPPECSGGDGGFAFVNTTFAPTCTEGFDPATHPQHPVACIDWCDATAFCAWAGKRLCRPSATDPSAYPAGEWFEACSRGGTRTYPNDDPDASSCRFAPAGIGDVGTPTCQGGFDGIYDMVGNVGEWNEYCNPNGYCRAAGPDGTMTSASNGCAFDHGVPRNVTDHRYGIRCCADLGP